MWSPRWGAFKAWKRSIKWRSWESVWELARLTFLLSLNFSHRGKKQQERQQWRPNPLRHLPPLRVFVNRAHSVRRSVEPLVASRSSVCGQKSLRTLKRHAWVDRADPRPLRCTLLSLLLSSHWLNWLPLRESRRSSRDSFRRPPRSFMLMMPHWQAATTECDWTKQSYPSSLYVCITLHFSTACGSWK